MAREMIRIFEQWCRDNSMTPNRNKSGVMYFDWKKNSKGLKVKEFSGYPVVREYKYLGGWLNDKLKVAGHLQHVERKVNFVMHKLTPIRMLKDLRLSVNLFRTMCMPLYRMGMLNALAASKTDQNTFFKAIRSRFKSFCYLPRCTPNQLVRVMLGSVEDIAKDMANRAFRNLQADQGDIDVMDIPAEVGYAKQIPSALYPLLDRMYRMACTDHNRLMNRAELKQHGIEFDIETMILRYQQKRRHNEVNQELRGYTAQIEGIGKRFTSKATLTKAIKE
jgi:hypothetical protein